MFLGDDEGIVDEAGQDFNATDHDESTDMPEPAPVDIESAQTDTWSDHSSLNDRASKDPWTKVCVDEAGVAYHHGDTVYWIVKDADHAFGMIGKIAGPSIFFGRYSVLVKFKTAFALVA